MFTLIFDSCNIIYPQLLTLILTDSLLKRSNFLVTIFTLELVIFEVLDALMEANLQIVIMTQDKFWANTELCRRAQYFVELALLAGFFTHVSFKAVF